MSIRLFDGHCDTAFELFRKGECLAENTGHIDLNRASKYSTYAQIFAFCSLAGVKKLPWTARELLHKPLALLRQEVQSNRERIDFAACAEDIRSLEKQGKMAALLSIEGAEVIDCDPAQLRWLRNQGFVMTTLTWNFDNALGGFHGSDKGLTGQGRVFVRQAQELGILIDVSHLNEASFWDLMKLTQAPIVASHSNCRTLCNHSRNLSDDQLRAIGESGGTVGLNFYPLFLGEGADFELLRRHLEHMLRLCGEKHVAMGGDLDGCDELATGISHVGDYTNFYDYLYQQGYEVSLLEDIFYHNLLRLL